MEKEDINILAQLLTSMEEAVNKLEESEEKKDSGGTVIAKKSVLMFQREIDKIL